MKISKRDLLARFITRINLPEYYLGFANKVSRPTLTVLTYHRVLDINREKYLFDEGVVSASSSKFERQIRYIKKNFTPLSFSLLKMYLEKENGIPKNSLIITFDDGYKDNYEIAYPILKKYNVPATFFLTTNFIGERKLFWWDKVAYIVKNTTKDLIMIEQPEKIVLPIRTTMEKLSTINSLLKIIKSMPDERKEQFIKDLATRLKVKINESEFCYTLDWSEVRKMSQNGIEMGSHSENHPVFTNVNDEVLKNEIVNSKKKLKEEICSDVLAFSCPGGRPSTLDEKADFSKKIKTFLKDAAYSFCTTYIRGKNNLKGFDCYRIKRICIELEDSFQVFKGKILFPYLIRY